MKITGIDTYFGGKGASGTYQKIINCIRAHNTLIIPFLGNCAITRHISRANHTVCIDADPQIMSLWEKMELDNITLLHGNGIEYLEKLITAVPPELTLPAVIYCDPPYPKESRKCPRQRYKYELSNEDHEKLLSLLKQMPYDVLISTYPNELYAWELKDWKCKSFLSTTRRGRARELLYMNYDDVTELHDYSYLGETFRERERIKKKINRFVKKLTDLPRLERNAIVSSIK